MKVREKKKRKKQGQGEERKKKKCMNEIKSPTYMLRKCIKKGKVRAKVIHCLCQ